MKKMIRGAKEASDAFVSVQKEVEDNFNYTLEGFDKLARDGKEKVAMDIMTSLNTAIEDAIAKIASSVAE